jgi:hypothetical protein
LACNKDAKRNIEELFSKCIRSFNSQFLIFLQFGIMLTYFILFSIPLTNNAIHVVTLTKIFLQTISIVRYKILWLEVEKHHFILIIDPHVNKYIFQAQYSLQWP